MPRSASVKSPSRSFRSTMRGLALALVGAVLVAITGVALGASTAGADPVSSPVPVITGAPIVGNLLTADVGSWSPTPDSFQYQWFAGPTAISGATLDNYQVADADHGLAITVQVTASRAGEADITVVSLPTELVNYPGFMITSAPVIHGVAQYGQMLTSSLADWSPTPTLSYQWLRNGTPIPGALATTYAIQLADIGQLLSLRVTAAAAGVETAEVEGSAVGPVAPAHFRSGAVAHLTGRLLVGQVVHAVPGVWSPAATSFAYQWYRGAAAIAGAVSPAYRLSLADGGQRISVHIQARRAGYLSVVHASAPSPVVTRLLTTAVPRISGVPRVGSVLTAVPGAWAPAGLSFRYQWYYGNTKIGGATGRSYRPSPAINGHTLYVAVTGIRAGYLTATRNSARVVVHAAPKPPVLTAYPNCTELTKVYPHGVARAGVTGDRVSGVLRAFKGTPYFSTALYNVNRISDRDQDGIACER